MLVVKRTKTPSTAMSRSMCSVNLYLPYRDFYQNTRKILQRKSPTF